MLPFFYTHDDILEEEKEREPAKKKKQNNFIINMKEYVVFMKLAQIAFKNPLSYFS